jgi:GNAT superfamily N-acetyltransferase
MRAHEFEPVSEKVNKEIFTPDWTDRQPILDGKYFIVSTIKYYGKIPNLYIEVYDSSKEPPYNQYPYYVAYARFRIVSRLWWKHLEAGMVSVNEKYRRQGIAAAIYQYVTKLGNTVKPSSIQLPDGKAMWKGFKKKDVLAIEQNVNEAKTTREDFEGVTIEMVKNGHVLVIHALDDWGNNILGSVAFNIGDDNDLDPQDLKVDERYQGQGIARIMYDYAKSKGYEIHRSYDQTDAGAGFWNKHRGEDVRIWEAFDRPYKGKWEKSDYGDVDLNTKLPDGTNLNIMFNQGYNGVGEEIVQVEFHRNNSQEVTGEGDAQRIFATVIDAIQKYIKKYKPQRLIFSASKSADMDADDNGAQFNPESRAKLYDRLVQRYSKALGYRAFRADNGDIVIYELSRIKQGVVEAFDKPYPIKFEHSEYGDVDALTRLPDGTYLSIMFNQESGHDGNHPSHYSVEFYRNSSQEVTGEGDAYKVFATVIEAIRRFVIKMKPDSISFSASKEPEVDMAQPGANVNPESRAKLYNRLVQRYAGAMGYSVKQQEGNNKVTYTLKKSKAGVAENADNKENHGRKVLNPDVYEDLANSIIARVTRQIVPTIRAKSTPEGYVYLKTADGLSLVIGCSIADGSIGINIGTGHETTSSGPHKGAVTKIIQAVYQAAVKKYGTPSEPGTLSIDHDAGHGVWQHIAQKLGLQYDAYMVKENFADGRNPQDKGDSKRYHVPTKSSVSNLRKFAKSHSGRAAQLAHWAANMKAGRAKKK